MKLICRTIKRSIASLTTKEATPSFRPLLALSLAVMLIAGPVAPAFGQRPDAGQTSNVVAPPPAQNTAPAASSPGPRFSLGLSKYDFTHGPRAFPNFIRPYFPISVERPDLTNSPGLEQLIHDGKLELTLQDAIELALENNLDIIVARYNPWLAETDVLRSLAGGGIRGSGSSISTVNSTGSTTQGAFTSTTGSGSSNTNQTFNSGAGSSFALGASPQQLSFDPVITSMIGYDYRTSPVNNPFLSGTGNANVFGLVSHTATYNLGVAQGFWTGTSAQVAFDNSRSSSNSPQNLFNPAVQSSLFLAVSQQLLNGFGILPNTRNIRIAKNNKKIADLQFELQAITTVTSTITAYWELVYARENVKVQQQAVSVSEKLYNDNKKQLEIGTMAPLDVTRAQSELASGRQNLILAQTSQLQQEQILKATISKNPLGPRFVNVEVIPTDRPTQAQIVEALSFEEAVQEAFQKRPDIRQQEINQDTQDINVRVTRNGLLPVATVTGTYGTVGLNGNRDIRGTPVFTAGSPVVNGSGVPIVITQNGAQVPIFMPIVTVPSTGTQPNGLGGSLSQVFHNQFPVYSAQLNVQIPIRNRQAQADNQAAILQQRQAEARFQQVRNSALLDVRNTYIALQQNRARVDAAVKARELQQQTSEAKQKNNSLRAATVYLVIQTQRDFVTAQGTELRALVDLVQAKANYERAVGRTLDTNRVSIAEGTSIERETLIPGTLHGKVIGTETLISPGEKTGER